jgi:hypothetical protein
MRKNGVVLTIAIGLPLACLMACGKATGGTMLSHGRIAGSSQATSATGHTRETGTMEQQTVVFATIAEDTTSLRYVLVLAESIRTFAGRLKDAPIWVYAPQDVVAMDRITQDRFSELKVAIKESRAPVEALTFFYARKVFDAAKAESEADGRATIIVWMDPDTIVLGEPADLMLSDAVNLGFRPVMHLRIASLYAEPPDAFWSRLYERLHVAESTLFPMTTIADHKTIRPYFNAGLLVTRPECGVFRKWAADFSVLYRDSVFVEMCREDKFKNVFLHQAALVGAVLNLIPREQMIRLPDRYNYPVFFKQMFGADEEFDSLDGVVTLRHEGYFDNPPSVWEKKLKAPAEILAWLKAHF